MNDASEYEERNVAGLNRKDRGMREENKDGWEKGMMASRKGGIMKGGRMARRKEGRIERR